MNGVDSEGNAITDSRLRLRRGVVRFIIGLLACVALVGFVLIGPSPQDFSR